jgi:hypothetical protein
MRLSLRNLIGSPFWLHELSWVYGIPVSSNLQRRGCRTAEGPISAEVPTSQGSISGMIAMHFLLHLARWLLMVKSTFSSAVGYYA